MTSIEKFELVDSTYERLMRLHSEKLKKKALKLMPNKTDADDLYQDTAIKLYMNMHKMTSEQTFLSWAMRVMERIFLDYKRKKKWQITLFEDLNLAQGNEVEFVDPNVDVESEVMLKMVEKLNSHQLRNMISTLTPELSSYLSLNTYGTSNPLDYENSSEGLHYLELAKLTGIKPETMRPKLFRARQALSTKIAQENWNPY